LEKIRINGAPPYDVHIGWGILNNAAELFKSEAGASPEPLFIVTDRNVARFHLELLRGHLTRSGFEVRSAVLKAGERTKSSRSLFRLLASMVRHGLKRDSIVIGLGGGVIGDLAGFAASIYMRGCRYVQIPTTLLAQVDSSVGGKVGINLREGKNLAGSFYNPLFVLCDAALLKTLEEREMVSGLAEVVKYGLIADRDLFQQLAEALKECSPEGENKASARGIKERLLTSGELLIRLIRRSVEIKGMVVQQDERESGLRMILNFGHTFGHAVEQLFAYRRFLHGEAVILGMKIAVELSCTSGFIGEADRLRVLNLLDIFPLPNTAGLKPEKIFSQMGRDKKVRGGKLHYVVLKEIGKAEPVSDIKSEPVLESIERVLEREKER